MALLTSADRAQVGPVGHTVHRHEFHMDHMAKCKHEVSIRRNG